MAAVRGKLLLKLRRLFKIISWVLKIFLKPKKLFLEVGKMSRNHRKLRKAQEKIRGI